MARRKSSGTGSDLVDAMIRVEQFENPMKSLPKAIKIKLMDKLFDNKSMKAMLDAERKRTGITGKKAGGAVRAMKNGGAVMNGRGPKFKGQS